MQEDILKGIVLENFSKNYGKFSAVTSVSFVAKPNSITGLIGENGAGKTTILKAITALHFPSSGIVKVNGIDTKTMPDLVKKNIGYVAEQPPLYPNFTVLQFLKFIAEIRLGSYIFDSNERKKIILDSINKVIELCSLSTVINSLIHTLSKGYRQRLSFAAAVIHEPDVLILDEPTSGLDPIQIAQMRDLIKKMAKTKTVLISTHIMQEVESLCSEINIISNGQLKISGRVDEVVKKSNMDSLEKAFIFYTKGSQKCTV